MKSEVSFGDGISIIAGEYFHIFQKQYLLEVADQINPGSGDIREADAKWVLGKKLGVTVCVRLPIQLRASSLFILFSH